MQSRCDVAGTRLLCLRSIANAGVIERALQFSNGTQQTRRKAHIAHRNGHLIDLTGLGKDLIRVDAYPATDEQIGYCYLPEYVRPVKDSSAAAGAMPSAENWHEIAMLAAVGGLAAIDAILVFANVRPPGHHATAEAGMGFYVLNTIVIATRYAQKRYGTERVTGLDESLASAKSELADEIAA